MLNLYTVGVKMHTFWTSELDSAFHRHHQKTVSLYYHALKIHSDLPKCSHHCIALTATNALTFQNIINHWPLFSDFKKHNIYCIFVWDKYVSLGQFQKHSYPILPTEIAVVLFFTFFFGMTFLITSEYYNLLQPQNTDCTFSTVMFVLIDCDMYYLRYVCNVYCMLGWC